MSFELADGTRAEQVEDRLRLVRRRDEPRQRRVARRAARPRRAGGRVPEGLLRLSVGLEHVDDLWDDLNHALGQD